MLSQHDVDDFDAAMANRTRGAFPEGEALFLDSLNFINEAVEAVNPERLATAPSTLRWILGIASRSFNTGLCAYRLWLRSYYPQTAMLTRQIDEDCLFANAIARNDQEVIEAFTEGRRPKITLKKLAAYLGDGFAAPWQVSYDAINELVHTRAHGIAIQLNGDRVRIGPVWDEFHGHALLNELLITIGQMAVLSIIPAAATNSSRGQDFVERAKLTGEPISQWLATHPLLRPSHEP